MFCADLAYLPHWETQMDLLVKSHFDCFEHVLLKNSKGSDVSFGNLLVTLLIYINMSCKLKKNYTIENDHKILNQRIYMIRHSICVQQRKLCCLSRGRFTSPHSYILSWASPSDLVFTVVDIYPLKCLMVIFLR